MAQQEPGPEVTIYEVAQFGQRGRARELPDLALRAVRLIGAADRSGLIALLSFTVLSGLLVAVEAFAARAAITAALDAYSRREGVSGVLAPVLVFLLATIVSGAVAAYSQGRQELLAERATMYGQHLVMDAATRVPLAAFDTPEFANRLQRASMALHQPLNLVRALLEASQAFVMLVVAAVSLLVLAPWLALMVPVAVVPVVFAFLRRGDAYFAFAFSMTPAERERGYLVQVLTDRSTAKEVRAFGVAPFLRARYQRLTADRLAGLRTVLRSQLVAAVVASVATGVLVGALVIGLLELALTGRFALADLTVGAGLVTLVGSRVGGFGWAVSALWEAALFLRNVTSLADPAPADYPGGQPATAAEFVDGDDRGVPVGSLETLRVQGVRFAYPSSDQPALDDVDLVLRAGEVVALVGENGSGKTTLAKLIGGFYSPGGGEISWNGIPMQDLAAASLREQVTVLFQDFVHYSLSAHLNIGLGHPRAVDDDEAVRTAARRAGADEVIEALPDGYATMLGPTFVGGTDLSGGQWQRIALARALVRDASLVVLDEPTAALDPRAEHELFARIRSVFAGRAVLLVSHRFSTVREADRIYVLHQGRVVEHGNHAELMARQGHYEKLYELQAAAFRD